MFWFNMFWFEVRWYFCTDLSVVPSSKLARFVVFELFWKDSKNENLPLLYLGYALHALLPGRGVRFAPLSSSSVVFCVYVYEVTV